MIRKFSAVCAAAMLLLCCGCGNQEPETGERVPIDGPRRTVSTSSTASVAVTGTDPQPTDTGYDPGTQIIPAASSTASAHSSITNGTEGRKTVTVTTTVASTAKTNAASDYTAVKSFAVNKSQSSGRITYDTPAFSIPANGNGLVRITVKNASYATKLTVYFATKDDPNFTLQKCVDIPIDFGTANSREYIADISELYGFTGTLTKVRIVTGSIYDGAMTLEKVEILQGGKLIAPFTLSDKTVAISRKSLKKMSTDDTSLFPDGVIGISAKGDGTFHFVSSDPVDGLHTVTVFDGTPENPFRKLVSEKAAVKNTPFDYGMGQFNYVSVGQVYRFSDTECFTILHLERHFDDTMKWDVNGVRSHKNNSYMAASLALGYSADGGLTWNYAGEVITHSCESVHPYFGFGEQIPTKITSVAYSRDICNGPFIIKDGYVYVYFTDFDSQLTSNITVARASLNDVIKAARAKSTARQTGLFKKYYNGKFEESGIDGKSSTIIDSACPPNFMTVIYSTYLKKYVFARCTAPAYATNDGDIVMNISADPLNFKGNNYYIDAGLTGSQYPTLIATDGSDPGMTAGKSVYLYYIDAPRDDRFLWDKADIVRRLITFR